MWFCLMRSKRLDREMLFASVLSFEIQTGSTTLNSGHLVQNSEFQKCLISRITNQLQKQIQPLT